MATMRDSSADMLAWTYITGLKLREIITKMKARNPESVVSEQMARLSLTCFKLHDRYQSGDYRHSDTEVSQMREMGELLVVLNARLNGEPDPPPLQFDEEYMMRKRPIPANAYQQIVRKIQSGEIPC